MTKTDKKIISIFLLLIILITQLSPVFATDNTTEETKTLTQYLIENGVDSDGDGVLSDAEWAKVKNLDLENIDITGIEKAVNLKTLYITGINPELIDFSKYTKLKELRIYFGHYSCEEKVNLTFPKMDKLENLYISAWISTNVGGAISHLDLTKLRNLKNAELYCMEDCDIKFPNLDKINELIVTGIKNDTVLDLSNSKNLNWCSLTTDVRVDLSQEHNLMPNLKYDEQHVTFVRWQGTNDYIVDIDKIEDKEMTFKLGDEFTYFGYVDYTNPIELAEDSILTETQCDGIICSRVGTEIIKTYDDFGNERYVKVTVDDTEYDTTLEDTGVEAEFIYDDTILKSNGELWKINSETTAEMVNTNVKRYIADYVYANNMISTFYIENTLKKDNTLIVKYCDEEKEIPNVTSMVSTMYVNTDGELYELNINYITEEMNPNKIFDNVSEIAFNEDYWRTEFSTEGGYYIVDTWQKLTYCNPIVKGEPRLPMTGEFYNEFWKGRFLSMGCNCDGEGCYKCEDMKKEEINTAYLREREDGNWVLGEKVIDNVKYICGVIEYKQEKHLAVDVLLRTDGSIWTYSEQYGLTKITKSTSINDSDDEEENKTENYLNTTSSLKIKKFKNYDVLTGISDGITVQDFINQNNFNGEYQVKIFDNNNNEIKEQSTSLATGNVVKLYKNGELVKEYTVVIYGDTTGDGQITAVDALAVVKHINSKILFTKEAYIEAGKVKTASGGSLTAVDALAIVKSTNGQFTINQNK